MRTPIRLIVAAFVLFSFTVGTAYADEAEGHYRMGLSLKRKGDLAGATREVREAVKLRPDHSAAWMTLGSLRRDQNDMAGAHEAFERAIKLTPKHQPAYALDGAVLIRSKKYEQAVERLRTATQLDKDDMQSVGNLGLALRQLGRTKEAIEVMHEMGIERVGMLLSERDSIVYPRSLAPEVRLLPPERVHAIADYTGATREAREACIDEIVSICRRHGYGYVFAGYGFMSEDPHFVGRLEEASLRFIGPSSAVQRAAGAK